MFVDGESMGKKRERAAELVRLERGDKPKEKRMSHILGRELWVLKLKKLNQIKKYK